MLSCKKKIIASLLLSASLALLIFSWLWLFQVPKLPVLAAATAHSLSAQIIPSPKCLGNNRSIINVAKKHQTLPEVFSILVWNLQKKLIKSLAQQAVQVDLLMLQEVHGDLINQRWMHNWHRQQAVAFYYQKQATGVMTASKVAGQLACMLRYNEPLFRLPKTALLNYYWVDGINNPLLVINLHSINFTGLTSYSQFLRPLLDYIDRHLGPIIFAGDFNAWNSSRADYLDQQLTARGLAAVNWKPDKRSTFLGSPLDQVYYRGLKVVSSQVIASQLSDHNQMRVTFINR